MPAFLVKVMNWLTSLEWLELSPQWFFSLPPAYAPGLPSVFHYGLDDELTAAVKARAGKGWSCCSQADWKVAYLPMAAEAAGHGVPVYGLCCFPFKAGNQPPHGQACLFFQTSRRRPESELEFLHAAVCLLAGAFRQKQAENLLAQARHREKCFFDASSRIILILNPDQTIRAINRKGCELLGYPEEEIVHKNWITHFMPDRLHVHASDLFQNLARGELQELNDCAMHMLARNQPERLIAWHCRILKDGDGSGQVSAMFCSGEDITQRHKNDEAFWENTLRDRCLFQNSPIALWEIDDTRLQARIEALPDHPGGALRAWLDDHPETLEELCSLIQIKECNRAAINLFFLLQPTAPASAFLPFLTSASLPNIRDLLLWFGQSQSAFEAEFCISSRPDQPFFGHLQVSPLTNFGKCNHHYLLSVLDITSRRITENSLKKSLVHYSGFFEDSPIAILQVELDIHALLETFPHAGVQDMCAGFSQLPDGVGRFLKFIRVVEANRAAKDFFDLDSPLKIQNALPAFMDASVMEKLKQVIPFFLLRNARVFESELIGRTPKGRPVRAFMHVSLIAAASAEQVQALVSITDITERMTLEENLRTSEQTQRALVENLGIGVISMNLKCGILTINRQMREWFPGLAPGINLVCVHLSTARPSEEVCRQCPVTATQSDGRVHESVTCIPRDAVPAYYRIVSSPVKDADNHLLATIVLMENITIKYLMEQQLQKTHERIERLISAIPSILITLDENNMVVNWNSIAEKAFGLPAAQTLGKWFTDSGVRWDWDQLLAAVRDSRLSYQNSHLVNFRFQHSDGKTGVLDLVIAPVKGENLASPDILILGTDLTYPFLLQQQLLQSQKLESIGQLAAGIAHEINTPTQYVGDNIRFLKEAFGDLGVLLEKHFSLLEASRLLPAVAPLAAEIQAAQEGLDYAYLETEIPKAIQQSLEGVERVTGIVRAMKDFAHPDTGEKTPVNLNQAISSTVTVARNEWKYVAEVRLDFDPELPPVPCLPGEFNQVILNMIINAAHAIGGTLNPEKPVKGLITITTRASSQFAEIYIADNGSGIQPAILPKIFDPFFTTKEVGRGTGQGLSISHNVIVEKHGGSIAVETAPGKGTTFIIRLPLQAQETPKDKVP